MANSFKDVTENGLLTIIGYFSKSGNDSNDGLTKDTPKKSLILNAGTSNKNASRFNQIGAGTYNLNNTDLGNLRHVIGDGKVIILNARQLNTEQTSRKIEYVNGEWNFTGGTPDYQNFKQCILQNCYIQGLSNRTTLLNSIFINSPVQNSCTLTYVDYSIIINSNFVLNSTQLDTQSSANLINTYIARDVTFFNLKFINNKPGINDKRNVYNCNFRGIIQNDSSWYSDGIAKSYAVQDQLIGTPQDNGYPVGVNWINHSQLVTDGYLFYNDETQLNNALNTIINRDPKFNNESLKDFSLQADSPHIQSGIDFTNIGGTDVAISTLVEDNGTGTTEVIPSAEIDTSITNSWKLLAGEVEGFIDIIQRVAGNSVVLGAIDPVSALNFDSDFAGGTAQNNNVIDSEPLTGAYPRKLTTTSLAANTTTVNVTAHNVLVGEFVRVAGEDREVTAVATNSFTVASAFRAAVANAVTFQVGTSIQLGALRPNRLTYLLRTSNRLTKPTQDIHWDNDVAPIYGVAGAFLTQEWYEVPGYVITGSDIVFGSGDSEADPSLTKNEIACKWVQIRIYIRNNYAS